MPWFWWIILNAIRNLKNKQKEIEALAKSMLCTFKTIILNATQERNLMKKKFYLSTINYIDILN